jgi:hypothetical protein
VRSEDRPSANGRAPVASAENELDELRARCRRQAVVIHTLGDLVATFKGGARALKAENAWLRAENERLNGERRSEPCTEAGADRMEPAEAAIPLGVHAPRAARTVVTQCLDGRVAPPVLASALLVVSELVTNSVRHSGLAEGRDVVVRVRLWGERCRVEVEDPGCDGAILPLHSDPEAGARTGLDVVQALSERWGVVRAAGGPTRVWAQLPSAAPLAHPPLKVVGPHADASR